VYRDARVVRCSACSVAGAARVTKRVFATLRVSEGVRVLRRRADEGTEESYRDAPRCVKVLRVARRSGEVQESIATPAVL